MEPMNTQPAAPPGVPKRRGLGHRLLQQWDVQLMIVPAILFILVIYYVPMWGVLTAFQDYNLFKGFFGSPWVGFKHFETFFSSADFWVIMRNTVVISLLKLGIVFPAPILLALMFNEVRNMMFKRVIQTITYLPNFLSWVIVGGFVGSMLAVDGGSINELLVGLGFVDEPVNWLSIPSYFWTILVTTNLWKEIGFASIVYLAAIAGVNPNLYEAASVDGASRIKQIFLVTLPTIAPVIMIFFLLDIGKLLNAGFEDILVLTNNGNNTIVSGVSEVIDTYVYKMGINNLQYSFATAVGLFKAILNIGLLVGANYLARRAGKESLW